MYKPKQEILEKYADVMVNFALGKGNGIKEKEVVHLQFDLPALPLAIEVYKKILQKNAYAIIKPNVESFAPIFYENAQDHQLEFFPENYMKSLVDTIDHRIYLIAEADPFLLKNVPPEKIMKANQSSVKMRKWLNEKENQGKLSWTLCLYGTEGQAKEAGLTLEEFWNQIINACFLEDENPIQTWQNAQNQINKTINWLNNLPIEKIHVEAKETDLWISLGEKRQWLGGRGANIPSFEIFTSPDWRGTNGKIYFDQPLYRYGNLIKDVRLEFKDGKVVSATASQNENLLQEMIKQENADKIGEYSLTDKRLSKISKFMANTLFDENFGGEFGNTHLAVGMSYHDTYIGEIAKMNEKDWEELGFNFSVVHTDIISTGDRTVTAIMKDGSEKIIYKDGMFILD